MSDQITLAQILSDTTDPVLLNILKCLIGKIAL